MNGTNGTTDSSPIHGLETYIPEIIISGGQRGADLGSLVGSRELGIATGGYCPKGWRTESGPYPDLGSVYGLIETESSGWDARTYANVEMVDVVILVAYDFDSPGTALTKRLCVYKYHKPVFEIPFPRLPSLESEDLIFDVKSWVRLHEPALLMVAGNRESKAKGIEEWTRNLVRKLFS